MNTTASIDRLARYNVVLTASESAWLDRFAEEIHNTTNARISRSEIIRAAIAGLRELHRLGSECPFPPLTTAVSGEILSMLAVVAARLAAIARD